MQFAGMPTLQSEARERDEFIRAMTGYFAEHTRQLIEATKLPKCEFAAAFDRLDALLFHLEEVKALDRLLRWDSNRMYQSKDLQAVGERLAARVRLARHLGGSLSLVEKREAIAILEDDVRLIRAWAREADEADRLAVAAELEKVDPVDPFACRAGLDHLAEVMLVPIAKRDPALKIPWIERMPAGKAVELAQLTANGITEIKKAWTEPPPKGSQTIKAVIDALNLFGSPHPLTGIDQLHARCMTLREGVASAIAELKAPRGQAVGAAPAGK